MALQRLPRNMSSTDKATLTAMQKTFGKAKGKQMFLANYEAATEQADPHMTELKAVVERLVKKGLKIPPAGIKVTRGRGGVAVSKIEMQRNPRKKAATKKAAAKTVAKT